MVELRVYAWYLQELCRTLAGNVCPLLTITDFSAEGRESRQQGEGQGGKRGVVVTARVHPGETNSSWMMDGLVSFLTSDSAHAQVWGGWRWCAGVGWVEMVCCDHSHHLL